MTPGRSLIALPGVVVHRCHLIDPADIVVRPDGIRLTSVPRTLFDLATVLRDETLESVVEQALRLQLTDVGELRRIGQRLRTQGRNGSARFGRLLDTLSPTARPVESDLELIVERALVHAGLPRPIRQHPFTLSNGSSIRVDFYWPEFALVLEVDHDEWHGSREDRAADKQRDRHLQRVGVQTVRITDGDVATRLAEVINDLFAIIAHRSRAS
jgi:very-short-patch-repair endonuclease